MCPYLKKPVQYRYTPHFLFKLYKNAKTQIRQGWNDIMQVYRGYSFPQILKISEHYLPHREIYCFVKKNFEMSLYSKFPVQLSKKILKTRIQQD